MEHFINSLCSINEFIALSLKGVSFRLFSIKNLKWFVALTFVTGLCSGELIWAERTNQRESIHFQYYAVENCPDKSSFISKVRSRKFELRLVEHTSNTARLFSILIIKDKQNDEYKGKLIVHGVEGKLATREVIALSCKEAFESMVIITGLALDELSTKNKASSYGIHNAKKPNIKTKTLWIPSAGLQLGTTKGIIPGFSVSYGGFIGVQRNNILLSIGLMQAGSKVREQYSADFRFTISQMDACYIFAKRWNGFGVNTCFSFEIGHIRAHGKNAESTQSASRPWFSLGSSIAIRKEISRQLWLGFNFFASLPLIKDRFVFQGDNTIHEVPSIAGGGIFSLGLSIL